MAYTEVTIAGYNAAPPPDDGSSGANNQVSWTGIKTKLADPLKTAIESIDDNVASAISSAESTASSGDAANLAIVQANLYAPSGTVMMFRQTSAPTGWTKDTSNYNDHALRVTTGTPGAYVSGWGMSNIHQQASWGGSSSSPAAAAHTHSLSGTALDGGAHTHTYVRYSTTIDNVPGGGGQDTIWKSTATDTTSTSGSHSHTLSGTALSNGQSSAHSHTTDLRLKYVDVIFATKV